MSRGARRSGERFRLSGTSPLRMLTPTFSSRSRYALLCSSSLPSFVIIDMMMLNSDEWLTGHSEIESTGKPGDEEGHHHWGPHHHHVLHAVWCAGICCVREHCARQLLDRIRLLRSILACRHREYMHRRPSHRCLPGKHLKLGALIP